MFCRLEIPVEEGKSSTRISECGSWTADSTADRRFANRLAKVCLVTPFGSVSWSAMESNWFETSPLGLQRCR